MLILGDTSNTALSVVRQLAGTGLPLYGVSVDRQRHFSFWSRFWEGWFPLGSGEESLPGIVAALSARHGGPCLILPVTEPAALAVDRVRQTLRADHVVFLSPSRRYAELMDKRPMLERARLAGFTVPRTLIGLTEGTFSELGYPVIVKTPDNLAGKQYVILPDANSAFDPARYPRPEELLIQEFITGDEFVISACRFKSGRVVLGSITRKVASWPPGRGEAVASRTEWVDGFQGPVSRLLESSDWYGMADIDLIRDARSGRHHFLEVNYRVGAGIAVQSLVEKPLLVLLVREALGIPPPDSLPRMADGILLIQDALFSRHLLSVPLRETAGAIRLLLRADCFTIFSRADLKPFFMFWWARWRNTLSKLGDPAVYRRRLRKFMPRR